MQPARRRTAIAAAEKLAVLDAWAQCGDIASVINAFYSGLDEFAHEQRRKLIYQWRQKRASIELACRTARGRAKKKARTSGTGMALPAEAERELVVWVNELRGEGVPISAMMLHLQALEVAADYDVTDFKASWSWMKRFKARNKLSMRARTRQGQTSPADLDKIAADFSKDVAKKVQDLGIKTIYNADQTAVFFEYLPARTISKRGAKTVWVRCGGKSKERATVMLLADSDGNKMAPFVVFKTDPSKHEDIREQNTRIRHGFGVRLWKTISQIQESTALQVYGNKKGWWDSYLSIQFLRFHFGTREDPSVPILLLWDDFSGHWTKEVIAYAASINVVLMKVPPNATAVCQPADVSWNGPLKQQLRGFWVDLLRDQLKRRKAGIPFKLVPPDRSLIARWVERAWAELSEKTVKAGYKRSGLAVQEVDVVASEMIAELASLSLVDHRIGAVADEHDTIESSSVCDELLE